MKPCLLQCANVGTVLGGTGACAWSVTRALPQCRHVVAFFGSITAETREVFAGHELHSVGRLDPSFVRAVGADLVLLHNTPAHRVLTPPPAVALYYHHSAHRAPAAGDAHVYCSRWLASGCGATESQVCHQGVPIPPGPPRDAKVSRTAMRRARRRRLVVGRLCTPSAHKWPDWLSDFYRDLTRSVPRARWEFVGCPAELQSVLKKACGGRARFHQAGWQARAHLWKWDVLCYSNPALPESFGRVCAEAMRAGCVPVVDRQGGFCEQVEQGRTGFLCSHHGEFVDAFCQLEDPARRTSMAEAARLQADRQFSLHAFAARLRQAFATAVRHDTAA